jgi:hypothetical protein
MGSGGRLLAGLALWSFVGLATAASLDEQLEVRPAEVHRALPDEIEAMGAQLTELAAGFWESAKASPPRLPRGESDRLSRIESRWCAGATAREAAADADPGRMGF